MAGSWDANARTHTVTPTDPDADARTDTAAGARTDPDTDARTDTAAGDRRVGAMGEPRAAVRQGEEGPGEAGDRPGGPAQRPGRRRGDLAAYQLDAVKTRRVKKHAVSTFTTVRLAAVQAASSPMTVSVVLVPASRAKPSRTDRLQVIAADVTDAEGRAVAGSDGQPGTNAVIEFGPGGASPSLRVARARVDAGALRPDVVDRLLGQPDVLAGVARSRDARPRRDWKRVREGVGGRTPHRGVRPTGKHLDLVGLAPPDPPYDDPSRTPIQECRFAGPNAAGSNSPRR